MTELCRTFCLRQPKRFDLRMFRDDVKDALFSFITKGTRIHCTISLFSANEGECAASVNEKKQLKSYFPLDFLLGDAINSCK